jgi:hypothetical protein
MGGHYAEDYHGGSRAEAMESLVDAILAEPEASCTVPIDVVAHVARREDVYLFPRGMPDVDYALVDLDSSGVTGMDRERFQTFLATWVEQALEAGMSVELRRGPLLLLARP